jgi:glutamate-ammonia-ligase adenylyltransferase
VISDLGFKNPAEILSLISDFKITYSIKRLSVNGTAALNRIFTPMLKAVAVVENQNDTLARIFCLFDAISGRNVYFTLLAENPPALLQLVKLSSASSWIVNYITRFPVLLDELLDPSSLYAPLSRKQLSLELTRCMSSIDVDDIEVVMTTLRTFKQSNVLKIAAADIMGAIPIMVVSDYLSWLAECLVEGVLDLAWQLTARRHGNPPHSNREGINGFAVIAYGKLGGIELSYASDLDLVFLYGGVEAELPTNGEKPIPSAQFFARVAQRMVTLLTTQILSGSLYEIDLRLRPSGNSGLLVSSLDAYENYQLQSAWIWEQQALVRARFIAGDVVIGQGFAAIRRCSLGREREVHALQAEVRAMREKMRDSLENKSPDCFDVKQSRGGIADIEFIVQFAVLSVAHDHPDILQWSDVVRLLDSLQQIGFLTTDESVLLKHAYCLFREHTHRAALLEKPAYASETDFIEIRTRVEAVWQKYLEPTGLDS